jgi:membrane protein
MATDLPQRVTERVTRIRRRGSDLLRRTRRRRPWLDHVIRAYSRYSDRNGDHLAGAITFFGFLSFFPLIALVYAIVGYAAQVDPQVRVYVDETMKALLPGLSGELRIDQIHPRSTGVIGLALLLFTGIGWIGVLREALHDMWMRPRGDRGNFVLNKINDIVVLVVLGVGLLASVAISGLAASATENLLTSIGLGGTPGVAAFVRLLAIVIAVVFDTVIFALLFARLSGSGQPLRRMVRGAVFAAIGFELLKLAGSLLVSHTTKNPVYGIFAVTVGLMVWINLVARFTLFAAAWTATALDLPQPFRDQLAVPEDVREEMASRTEIPPQNGETEPAS